MRYPENTSLVMSVSLALSLALNGAALVSSEKAFQTKVSSKPEIQKKIFTDKKETIEFEFIEAPAKTYPDTPAPTNRISDRDSLDQDAAEKSPESSYTPKIDEIGHANQLAQTRGAAPVPPAAPAAPQKPAPEVKKEEEKTESRPVGEDMVSPEPQKQEEKKEEVISSARPEVIPNQQMPKPTLTGQDNITTQAMTKQASHGAKHFGITSFEATGSGMGEYMKNLKEKIWLAWFPYLAFRFPMDFETADCTLRLSLNKSGGLTRVTVLDSEGSPLFTAYCVDAVQRAGNFGTLPEEILALIGKDNLDIEFGFHYR